MGRKRVVLERIGSWKERLLEIHFDDDHFWVFGREDKKVEREGLLERNFGEREKKGEGRTNLLKI